MNISQQITGVQSNEIHTPPPPPPISGTDLAVGAMKSARLSRLLPVLALLLGVFALPNAASAQAVFEVINLSVSASGNTLSVSWDRNNDGAAPLGYLVHYTASTTVNPLATVGTNPATEWANANHSGTTPSHTISGLNYATAYWVRVASRGTNNFGHWQAVSVTTDSAVTLSVDETTVTEGSSVTVTVTLSAAVDAEGGVVVPIMLTAGTATETADYGTLTSITVPINEATATGTITTNDDDLVEGAETFTVSLGSLPTGFVSITPNSAEITIADNDAPPPTTLTLSASLEEIPEGGESVITATLDEPAPTGGTIIMLAIDTGSTATEGTDYTLAPKTLTIAASRQTGTATLTILTDEMDEESETITIEATSTNPVLNTDPAAPLRLTILAAVQAEPLQSEPLHRVVLPEVARAIADRTTRAVSARVGRAFSGNGRDEGGGTASASASFGGQRTLAGALADYGANPANHRRDLLSGSRFALPLNGDSGNGGGLRSASLWASGDYRDLSGEDGALEFDGNLYGAQIGVDSMVRDDLLAGVALSWSEGELAYNSGSSGGGTGDYEVDVVSLHPYLGGRTGHLDWWATLGYGNGEVEITPNGGQTASNDITMTTVGAGGSSLLWSRAEDRARVHLKGEFTRTRMEMDRSAQVDSLSVNAHLARVALATSRTRSLAGGARMSPSLSLGVRQDGGDGNIGSGAEIGGNLRYDNSASGVSASVSAHGLFGRSDYEEWGIQALVQMSAGADGQGLSFEMRPGYGGNASTGAGDTGRIWSHGLRGDATPATDDASGRLEMRMGYGLSASGQRNGLLTPWSGLTLHDNGTRYRMGLDWASAGQFPFTLRLSGERREHENANTDHAVLLKGEMRF